MPTKHKPKRTKRYRPGLVNLQVPLAAIYGELLETSLQMEVIAETLKAQLEVQRQTLASMQRLEAAWGSKKESA